MKTFFILKRCLASNDGETCLWLNVMVIPFDKPLHIFMSPPRDGKHISAILHLEVKKKSHCSPTTLCSSNVVLCFSFYTNNVH